MAKEKRFVKVYSQELGSSEIWVDKETGVNYFIMNICIVSAYKDGIINMVIMVCK